MKIKFIRNKQSGGQVLLIIVLIATVLMTIGLSLTQLTVDESKISKLEEDAKKARAAAEAGLDVALDQLDIGEDPIQIGDLVGNDITGEAVLSTDSSNDFVSPLISKDAIYTFYLTGYNTSTHDIVGGVFDDDLIVDISSPAGTLCGTINELALELTFVNNSSGIVTRRLAEENGCDIIDSTNGIHEINLGDTISTSGFSDDPHLLIARIIAPNDAFTGAKISITNTSGNDWPPQGKTVISTASTAGGVTKKIKLFQSYPQFPAEFFVTSF